MGLITCKECNKQVSNLAKTCPGCGSPVQNIQKKVLGFIILSVIAAVIISSCQDQTKPSKPLIAKTPEQQAEDDKNGTLLVLADKCAKVIEKSIKYPEDADIPNARSAFDRDKFFMEEKNDVYRVQVTFKARTPTNALRKTTAECKWKLVKDNYEPMGGLRIVD